MRTIMKSLPVKNGEALKTKCENDKIRTYMLHEISNPVTLIHSTMQLMEKESPEIKDKTRWVTLNTQMDHLIRLLNDYSALNCHFALDYTENNLVDLIFHILSGFEASALQKNAALRFLRVPAESGTYYEACSCDRIKLTQVLENLIKNALEAVPENGSVIVEIHAVRRGYVSISVTNSGPAIPSGILAHIFDPFFTTKPAGTGIGLALSKRIMEAHGGRLTVTSDPDNTCFTLCLPIEH